MQQGPAGWWGRPQLVASGHGWIGKVHGHKRNAQELHPYKGLFLHGPDSRKSPCMEIKMNLKYQIKHEIHINQNIYKGDVRRKRFHK